GEVNRYITWPGQACAYKVGEIKIKELRQKAQNALGSLFRLSDFHDVLLGCIGPLKIVEECVASYIEQTNLEIEKGGEEKGEEEESEGRDKDEHESSDPREQGVDSESVASEDAAGGRSSVAGSSMLVLVACWLATLRAAHYRYLPFPSLVTSLHIVTQPLLNPLYITYRTLRLRNVNELTKNWGILSVAMRQVCGGAAHQLLRKTVTAELRRLHHEGVIAQSGEEYGHCVSAPQVGCQRLRRAAVSTLKAAPRR
ncbi:hypothetical protein O3P69_019974, partial [Scylla paramamosain]